MPTRAPLQKGNITARDLLRACEHFVSTCQHLHGNHGIAEQPNRFDVYLHMHSETIAERFYGWRRKHGSMGNALALIIVLKGPP